MLRIVVTYIKDGSSGTSALEFALRLLQPLQCSVQNLCSLSLISAR